MLAMYRKKGLRRWVGPNLASILYLVSGVLFILALRGLSHPTTSRQGNLYGMVGMGIAILTTLFVPRRTASAAGPWWFSASASAAVSAPWSPSACR